MFNGMYIPKGTVLILNCYSLHHNEERYPDSSVFFPVVSPSPWAYHDLHRFAFNPDRYLGDDLSCAESAKLPDVMQRDHWTFGAG